MVDAKRRILLDGTKSVQAPDVYDCTLYVEISSMTLQSSFSPIGDKFRAITVPQMSPTAAAHDVQHQIITLGPEIRESPYRLLLERISASKAEFEHAETGKHSHIKHPTAVSNPHDPKMATVTGVRVVIIVHSITQLYLTIIRSHICSISPPACEVTDYSQSSIW